MRDLLITPTKITPEIIFKNNGELEINGSSFPENASNFFKPILEWIEEFKLSIQKKVTITIDVDYLNTSSSRCVFSILKNINAGVDIKLKYYLGV